MTTVLSEEQGLYCPTFDGEPTDDDLRPDIELDVTPSKLPFEQDQQRRVLSVVLKDKEVGKLAAEKLSPTCFTNKAHQAVASFVFACLREYDDLPSDELVMGEMKKRLPNNKSRKPLIQEVRNVLDHTLPNTCERKFYFDEIARFAKATMLRKAFTDALRGLEQGRYDFAPTIATLQEAQAISQANSSTLEALDAIEFFEMAEQDERSWLLDRWICEGSLHLFAGQKKIGKSTLLHSMIGSLMTGQDWFGEIGCQQAPVVYLDFENPADYVRSNLLQMMPQEEYKPVREWLRVPKSLPTALTGDWLLRFLDHNNLTAYSSGVIFIDSARRAFNGLFPDVSNWENNASEVSRCMQPMLKIARDTNFAVVIIHHDNKSNDSAGSVDWEAVSDFVWHYTASGTDRILSSKHGRYVGREPESMVFRKPEDRLQLAGLAGDIRAQQTEKKRQSKLDELVCDVVPYIPELDLGAEATETNTVTVRDLIEKTGKSRDVLQKELRSLRIEGVVQSGQMKPGKNKPLHYWRNNQALS